MEKLTPSVEKEVMDPRKKDTQGLDFWAAGLLKNNIIGQKEYADFVAQNNSKEKRMEERRLPQLRHYGAFTSIDEMREKIHAKEDDRFIIRCSDKKTGDIKRLIDASFEEVCGFAMELPGGFDAWRVELKEFADTKAAGTIIVSPSGRTTIETWHGAHYLNTTDCPKYRAELDPGKFDMHLKWSAPEGSDDLDAMQGYALKALKSFFPYLRPKQGEPIYAEYGVKANGDVYFIEANDSPLLTGKD